MPCMWYVPVHMKQPTIFNSLSWHMVKGRDLLSSASGANPAAEKSLGRGSPTFEYWMLPRSPGKGIRSSGRPNYQLTSIE